MVRNALESEKRADVIEGIPFEVINAKNSKGDPIISVICHTYRHSRYIKNCIEGILMQKTEYPYEVIIIDDASDDDTGEIIRDYAQKYQDKISVYIAGENVFSHGIEKLLSVWGSIYEESLHGKYIALCEGDDFWIDSNKLQIQTDFLESHPDYVMTVHNSIRYIENDKRIEQVNDYVGDVTVNSWDIIIRKKGAFSTASMMYRAEYQKYDDDLFSRCDIGDWTRQLYLFTKGKVYYHSRIMSVYRYMTEGSWTKRTHGDSGFLSAHIVKMWRFFDEYNLYTNRVYEHFLSWQKAMYSSLLADRLKESGKTLDYLENNELCGKLPDEMIKEVEDIFHNGLDAHYYGDEFYVFASSQKRVWLLGAGHYADVITKKLSEKGITLYAYSVLDGKNAGREKNGLTIYDLNSVTWDDGVDGLIVAMDIIRDTEEIMKTIDNLGIRNFIAPLWR